MDSASAAALDSAAAQVAAARHHHGQHHAHSHSGGGGASFHHRHQNPQSPSPHHNHHNQHMLHDGSSGAGGGTGSGGLAPQHFYGPASAAPDTMSRSSLPPSTPSTHAASPRFGSGGGGAKASTGHAAAASASPPPTGGSGGGGATAGGAGGAQQQQARAQTPQAHGAPGGSGGANSNGRPMLMPGFVPQDRSLPARSDALSGADALGRAYAAFILYCNPTFGPSTDTAELVQAFSAPPKSDGKSFSTWSLWELIERLERKDIKTWTQLALELGVEPPALDKGQSAQKVQQYSVRLKRWMHAMHIDAFFEYLLGKQHGYYMQIPPPENPFPESGRDGVPLEEDLAIRNLDPRFRPKRGRRKAEEVEDDIDHQATPPPKRPHLDTSMAFTSPNGFGNPHSAFPASALGDDFASTGDPWTAVTSVNSALTPHPSKSLSTTSAIHPQQLRWRLNVGGDSANPMTPHPLSAITPASATTDATFDEVPQSAITPSGRRARRRHGPAVSSAWPSSSSTPNGKLRGRPPSNRSVRDGPFVTFPANPKTKEAPTIELGGKDGTGNSGNGGRSSATPGPMPVVERAPSEPPLPRQQLSPAQRHHAIPASAHPSSSGPRQFPARPPHSSPHPSSLAPSAVSQPPLPPPPSQGRPERLQLQVPQHVGGPVHLITPTVLVNGQSNEDPNGPPPAPLSLALSGNGGGGSRRSSAAGPGADAFFDDDDDAAGAEDIPDSTNSFGMGPTRLGTPGEQPRPQPQHTRLSYSPATTVGVGTGARSSTPQQNSSHYHLLQQPANNGASNLRVPPPPPPMSTIFHASPSSTANANLTTSAPFPVRSFADLQRALATDLLRAEVSGRRPVRRRRGASSSASKARPPRLKGAEAKVLAAAMLRRLRGQPSHLYRSAPLDADTAENAAWRVACAAWLGLALVGSEAQTPAAANGGQPWLPTPWPVGAPKRIDVRLFRVTDGFYHLIEEDEDEFDGRGNAAGGIVQECFDISWSLVLGAGSAEAEFSVKGLDLDNDVEAEEAGAETNVAVAAAVREDAEQGIIDSEEEAAAAGAAFDLSEEGVGLLEGGTRASEAVEWRARYLAIRQDLREKEREIHRLKERVLEAVL
ncbi:ARS binding protein 2-domain-containing protein [Lineolata rhizophorae]|uniref:ARS binding protein 2-domain-containing protein n=1 Tax=Lineolata rhizophorae TaxID=578093 RepID=A0A6A6PEN3_9PEZI|nr:ARS binding protein 2-domain-containing protein [Lineolata rhizophorae]